ncbi:type II toxin-antitoxin system prevent-host-death family antitoxin [Lactococcus nasutitermitis]|uniref:Antitoxin n=1 Tax=Lactococcus nasutitermitis TaxID=1652957 RepID=A0ABV9JDD3_9LACT|nr:type II toxin-antitoxin system prevent-host-death family antitoxin [Lactococcus nasutitermitis]
METAPVSDLRNYTAITSEVREGSPVYLTKNGKTKYALVDAEEYDFMRAKLRLFSELRQAEIEDENGAPRYSINEVRENLGLTQ